MQGEISFAAHFLNWPANFRYFRNLFYSSEHYIIVLFFIEKCFLILYCFIHFLSYLICARLLHII